MLAASLKLVGSCRNEGDRARVQQLRQAAEEMGIAQHVEFCLGASNAELQRLLGGAVGGLHTMTDEHFGISVVEYMAAGAPAFFVKRLQAQHNMFCLGISDAELQRLLGSLWMACTLCWTSTLASAWWST